jgi:tetratricopeptide (TPR) repeat protein
LSFDFKISAKLGLNSLRSRILIRNLAYKNGINQPETLWFVIFVVQSGKPTMKFLIWIFFLLAPVIVFGQTQDLQNKAILAGQYYQEKEYGKAAELYDQLYSATKSEAYFNIYLDCLIGIPDFDRAEKDIRKGLRGNSADSYWYVQWGFLKRTMGQSEEAAKMYEKAISSISGNPAEFPILANQFISRREFEYAGKVYLKGRGNSPGLYNYELARIYSYMRNYDLMLNEYLEWIRQKESNFEIVKSNLQSVLSTDNDQEISAQLKTIILKRIQAEPGQILYTRLLIWLFIQDKNFPAAIRQAIALDKRTNNEDVNILNLADVSAGNKNYDEAVKAYDYLIEKGKKSEFYNLACLQKMQMQYDRFTDSGNPDIQKATELKNQFDQTFSILGYSPETSILIPEYAHLLAFYLDHPVEAIQALNKGLSIAGLNLQQISPIKEELADVQVYSGDLWDAVLTYSQVIEANKSNSLGDDVKFKKAKLGYYMGNFQWAKAQLDALRASTSKLIANDAMELSLFISENLEDDSISAPLQTFARADLQLFRNKFPEALAALDSISQLYPSNSLTDDVNFRKAGIFQKQGKYEEAAVLLESIVKENSWDMLADDALFQLAAIYKNNLQQKEKAMELYKKMLTDYPGSVYVVDSRAEYRKLQDSAKNDNKLDSDKTKEDLFFEGKKLNP